MRLSLLACLALVAVQAAPCFLPAAAARVRHSPRAQRHCPELRTEGFCPFDTGWRPARDNPLFSPLRPGDPEGQGGPLCWATDSRGRTLLSYETEVEVPAPALRIGGRLVRFRRASAGDQDRFVSDEGTLRIDEGAEIARAHESDGHRATLTFTDRRGQAHIASVRLDCGL
jgi:hypothetical protein